jgi:citrate lyase subunit beta/citryl-CoA lyase
VGKALGFLGRTAIHPVQLGPIREAFTPTSDEVRRARDIIEKVGQAAGNDVGAIALADGTFLDVAMLEHARAIVALAQ